MELRIFDLAHSALRSEPSPPVDLTQRCTAPGFRGRDHAINALELIDLDREGFRDDRVGFQARRLENAVYSLDGARFARGPLSYELVALVHVFMDVHVIQELIEPSEPAGIHERFLEPTQSQDVPQLINKIAYPDFLNRID